MQKEKNRNLVFILSVCLTLLICLWGILLPDSFGTAAGNSMRFLTTNFAWLYCLAMTLFVAFCLWIGLFSKYRNIPLGPDGAKPEYSKSAWFSMLFCAGMGVGLVFWGAAEPMNYFAAPIGGLQSGTGEAMRFAFARSFLHWGIHPWANYSVLALALAYMQFRKGQPGLISSVFIPLIGEKRARGWLGKTVDVLSVFATAAGVATSLGLGILQLNAGLHFLTGLPETALVQLFLILFLAAVYILTAVVGIEKGMNTVSKLNIRVSMGVLLLLVVIGPTVPILNNLLEGAGAYLSSLLSMTTEVGAFGDEGWYRTWTVFYWAWRIAWAPFTGSFIARISRGRTIGEFIKGVMFLPAVFSVIWFTVFGTLGMRLDISVVKEAIKSTSTALFVVLQQYPLGTVLCAVMALLIFTFLVTASTSATYVLGMYSEGGTLQPSNRSKIIWGALIAALAAIMMLGTGNGLSMLQTLSIVAAFPFIFIMPAAMPALVKALKEEKL